MTSDTYVKLCLKHVSLLHTVQRCKEAYKNHDFPAHSVMQKLYILCKQHCQVIGKDAVDQHAHTLRRFFAYRPLHASTRLLPTSNVSMIQPLRTRFLQTCVQGLIDERGRLEHQGLHHVWVHLANNRCHKSAIGVAHNAGLAPTMLAHKLSHSSRINFDGSPAEGQRDETESLIRIMG